MIDVGCVAVYLDYGSMTELIAVIDTESTYNLLIGGFMLQAMYAEAKLVENVIFCEEELDELKKELNI